MKATSRTHFRIVTDDTFSIVCIELPREHVELRTTQRRYLVSGESVRMLRSAMSPSLPLRTFNTYDDDAGHALLGCYVARDNEPERLTVLYRRKEWIAKSDKEVSKTK